METWKIKWQKIL